MTLDVIRERPLSYLDKSFVHWSHPHTIQRSLALAVALAVLLCFIMLLAIRRKAMLLVAVASDDVVRLVRR